MPVKIFISSVQNELQNERRELARFIRQDALLQKYFEPFLFEELPAKDITAEEAYLSEAENSEIYLGILGEQYGYEDEDGISPTEREYDVATDSRRYRIVVLKDCKKRHVKEERFIHKIEQDVIRNTFSTTEELLSTVYAALVQYLTNYGYLQYGPFDCHINTEATLSDLDKEKIRWWCEMAREVRKFPVVFTEGTMQQILKNLRLITENGRITNAALLLFAKDPQRWCLSANIKCIQFYGTKVEKPLATQQIYEGSLFEMIDQAVAFVMSHIDAHVGERTTSAQSSLEYELPMQAVTEAIVNAVFHRDYNSTGSIQVMLFKNRLEIWNPGRLPQGMTIKKLNGEHISLPVNPLLARPIYLAGYIEQVGTGTNDMINRCVSMGLQRPEFYQQEEFRVILWRRTGNETGNEIGNETGNETGNEIKIDSFVKQVIVAIGSQTLTARSIKEKLGLRGDDNFRKNYLTPALEGGYIAMLYPENPKRKGQAYYLTGKGLSVLEK